MKRTDNIYMDLEEAILLRLGRFWTVFVWTFRSTMNRRYAAGCFQHYDAAAVRRLRPAQNRDKFFNIADYVGSVD